MVVGEPLDNNTARHCWLPRSKQELNPEAGTPDASLSTEVRSLNYVIVTRRRRVGMARYKEFGFDDRLRDPSDVA